jgi:hypothetical protein
MLNDQLHDNHDFFFLHTVLFLDRSYILSRYVHTQIIHITVKTKKKHIYSLKGLYPVTLFEGHYLTLDMKLMYFT